MDENRLVNFSSLVEIEQFQFFREAVAESYFLKVASEQNSAMGAPTTGGDGGVKIPSWLPSLYGG